MKCIHGRLFTVNGPVEDEDAIHREIYELISPYITSSLAKRTAQLLDAIKLAAYSNPLPLQTDRLHVLNNQRGFENILVQVNPDFPF